MQAAIEKNYEVFALGFYGECHGGKSASQFEASAGKGGANDCIGADYKKCNRDSEGECAGVAYSEFVFGLTQQSPDEELERNNTCSI